jgi:Predicted nucleotide-binding protein containing TIR-like domain
MCEFSEAGRNERFERWERLGLDQVKSDLQAGGVRVIGGPFCEQQLAWEWVRMKEAASRAEEMDRAATGPSSGPLRDAISGRTSLERALGDIPVPGKLSRLEPEKTPVNSVFIVHGHDDGALHMVARFIEQLQLKAIILHERANKGRTIITKFQGEAAGIGFAIVLMTPDDLGKAKGAPDLKPRARQNVVFEFGFFIGALRPERVAALVKGDIERPSDLDGVVYISLDSTDWRTQLGRELQAAGFAIDWNLVMKP